MATKQHITLEAKATATDQGEFVAIAAAYSVDRVGDRIVPGAFSKTIDHWRGSGKSIPLHWNHQGEPEDIIGSVDPSQTEETKDGLKVVGKLDLSGAKAKEAWRAMKTGSMSLSFGYLVTSEKQAKDGVNDLLEIDLFEVSVVPGPANADTRFLSMKSIAEMELPEVREALTQLQKRLDELEAPEESHVEDEHEEARAVIHQASDPEAVNADLALIDALAN